jgi:hypothetical protein
VSEYRDLTPERYRADWKTQRIVERTLQMEGGPPFPWPRPRHGRDDGIPEHRRARVPRIDADVVIRILRMGLEDLRRFEAEALGWLTPEQDSG